MSKKYFEIFSILLFLPFFIACDLSYGPPFDNSKVVDAKMAGSGDIGVFTYKKLIYKPATGGRAFPDGGIPKYILDDTYIAVYDFSNKKIKVIYEENNLRGPWANGQGEFSILATYGKKVLVSQGDQRRSDLKSDRHFYWVDLDSGKLTKLPLQKELTQRKLEFGHLYLIDAEGVIVMVAPSLGNGPDWIRDTKANPHLLIRYPDGSYEDIAQIVHYYGVLNNDVHYWSSDNKYTIYNFKSKLYRNGENKEYINFVDSSNILNDSGLDLRVHYDKGYKLQACKKQDSSWLCENVDLSHVF